MHTTSDPDAATVRPVPRWVRGWAILTVAAAVVLIALGGLVTSFRVGMVDEIPFTAPWHLLGHYRLDFGYLVEHTHRIAGWAVGGAVVVLALGAFACEPDRRIRWLGIGASVLLVAAYGQFRGGTARVWEAVKEQAATEYRLDPKQPDFEARLAERDLVGRAAGWPVGAGVAAVVLAAAVLAAGGLAAAGGRPGGWVRAAAAAGLVLVMVQGLLGSFRVFLNALAGADLAAVHGVFAQVTFCVLVAAVVLAAPRRAGDALAAADRRPVLCLAWALVAATFVQLLWAVMVRHQGSAVAQRLHILTAFAVTGLAVWLAVLVRTGPARNRLGWEANHLLAILAVQLLLGVEAYMGKFAATGPEMYRPPMERTVTPAQAGVRTAHQLVGTGLLAAAVALALRAGRAPAAAPTTDPADGPAAPEPRRVPAAAGSVP